MPLKTFYEETCPDCGKKQTGREESNDRVWWTPCYCKQLPNCPVDYPRLVSKKSIITKQQEIATILQEADKALLAKKPALAHSCLRLAITELERYP